MRRPSGLSRCLIAATAFAVACGRPESPAPTATTLSPCAVARAAVNQSDDKATELQKRAQGQPAALEQLGFQYISRARRSNDPGDYTLAEQVAACLESRSPGHASALLIRGHVLHQQHRFKEAEALARRLVAQREFVLDYGLLGDVLMEQGDVAEATKAYQRMIDLKPFYQSYIRAAHVRWLTGDGPGATDLVRQAISAASPRDPEAIAWAYTRLAHYELQAGRLRDAANAANAALASQDDYAAALLVRGRVHTAAGRAREAVDDLRRAARLNPLPEYQWALADALRAAGGPDEAVAVERELESTGATTDPRTLALYLSTRRRDTTRALELTERELEDRADVFTLDARAWALAAAGRFDEAQSAITRALAVGTRDARLFLHAASIAAASGRQPEARKWAAQAHASRFTLLPSELEELQRGQSLTQEN